MKLLSTAVVVISSLIQHNIHSSWFNVLLSGQSILRPRLRLHNEIHAPRRNRMRGDETVEPDLVLQPVRLANPGLIREGRKTGGTYPATETPDLTNELSDLTFFSHSGVGLVKNSLASSIGGVTMAHSYYFYLHVYRALLTHYITSIGSGKKLFYPKYG